MIESPATETLPAADPLEGLEQALRENHNQHKKLSAVRGTLSMAVGRLISLQPTDANLEQLIAAKARISQLAEELNVPTATGDDAFPTIINQLEQAIEKAMLEGAFSWQAPTCRNVDLIRHARQISLTPAMVEQWGSLHGIDLSELRELPSPACHLATYLERDLSEEQLADNCRVAILPGSCSPLTNDGESNWVGTQLIRFEQVRSLMVQESGYVRAQKARAEAEREQVITEPETVHETEDRKLKRFIIERDIQEETRRMEAARKRTAGDN